MMEEEIQPILVIALLEHEGISNLTNDKPRPGHRARTGSNDNNLDAPGRCTLYISVYKGLSSKFLFFHNKDL